VIGVAFRAYTREEFEDELHNTLGLRFIRMVSPTLARWVTPQGNTILIRMLPDGEPYPHFMVGYVAQQAELLDSE